MMIRVMFRRQMQTLMVQSGLHRTSVDTWLLEDTLYTSSVGLTEFFAGTKPGEVTIKYYAPMAEGFTHRGFGLWIRNSVLSLYSPRGAAARAANDRLPTSQGGQFHCANERSSWQ